MLAERVMFARSRSFWRRRREQLRHWRDARSRWTHRGGLLTKNARNRKNLWRPPKSPQVTVSI